MPYIANVAKLCTKNIVQGFKSAVVVQDRLATCRGVSQVNNHRNHISCLPIVAMFAPIDVFGHAKNLTPSNDVLNGNTLCCQPLVEWLRILSQAPAPICLDGRRTAGIPFGFALITTEKSFLASRNLLLLD